MAASGASRAATGTIAANTDSILALAVPSDCVLIDNHSGKTCNVRLNGACGATTFDLQLVDGERAWVTEVLVSTVHVYVDATAGVRVVYW